MAIRQHSLFRLVDHPGPDVAKGGCYFSYDCGPGVDTGILIEFEGTLFFSLGTIRELAEVAGFSVNVEGVELERRNAELEQSVLRWTEECAVITQQLDEANRVIGAAVAATPQTPLSAVAPAKRKPPVKAK